MTPFKVGDQVKRIEYDIMEEGLIEGNEYVVSKSWCPLTPSSNNLADWRVELVGFNVGKYGTRPCWDAHRFELVSPHYVQACPHGIHWRECPDHRHGGQ